MELEELQVRVVDTLGRQFPGVKHIQEDDVVSKACVEMTVQVTELVKLFSKKESDLEQALTHLKTLLSWVILYSYVIQVECPLNKEIVEGAEVWPNEVIHCGILSSLMLQGKLSELTLDYFLLESASMESKEDLVLDILSLIHVLAERTGYSFEEVIGSI